LHFPYGPLTRVSTLVTKRTTVLKISTKTCKTQDYKTVDADTKLTFRIMGDKNLGEDPNLVRKFVHKIKPSELQRQLYSAQEEVVRAVLARSTIDEIAASCSRTKSQLEEETKEETTISYDRVSVNVTEDIRLHMNKQFNPQGVQIESVTIRTIHLPSHIQPQMRRDEIMIACANEEKSMHNKVIIQRAKCNEGIKALHQSFHEEKIYKMQTGREVMNSEKIKLNQAIAESRRVEMCNREMRRMNIANLKAQNTLEVQHIMDRKKDALEKIRAEFVIKVAEKLANTQLENQVLLVKANDAAVQSIVQSKHIMSTTEGKIGHLLQENNEYRIAMKKRNLMNVFIDNEDSYPREVLSPVSVTSDYDFLSQLSISEMDRQAILNVITDG